MPKPATIDQITKDFILHLEESGISSVSLKNYKSDLNHFSGWIILKVKTLGIFAETLTECIPFFSTSIGQEYKNFLVSNDTPNQTTNRRLSTLRNLSRFMVMTQIINFDFMDGLVGAGLSSESGRTIDPIIEKFTKHLEQQRASKNTIKNYVADLRHFVNWINGRTISN
jgi:site-specific recombinase XerD